MELVARLQALDTRLEGLNGSHQPLKAEASALLMEVDALKAWHPLFPRPQPGECNALQSSICVQVCHNNACTSLMAA